MQESSILYKDDFSSHLDGDTMMTEVANLQIGIPKINQKVPSKSFSPNDINILPGVQKLVHDIQSKRINQSSDSGRPPILSECNASNSLEFQNRVHWSNPLHHDPAPIVSSQTYPVTSNGQLPNIYPVPMSSPPSASYETSFSSISPFKPVPIHLQPGDSNQFLIKRELMSGHSETFNNDPTQFHSWA